MVGLVNRVVCLPVRAQTRGPLRLPLGLVTRIVPRHLELDGLPLTRGFRSLSREIRPRFEILVVGRRHFGRGKKLPPFGHAKFRTNRRLYSPLILIVYTCIFCFFIVDWVVLKESYGIDILPSFMYDLSTTVEYNNKRICVNSLGSATKVTSREAILAERHADAHASMQVEAMKSNLARMALRDPEVAALLEGRNVESPTDDALFRMKQEYVAKALNEIEELQSIARHPSVLDDPAPDEMKETKSLKPLIGAMFSPRAEEALSDIHEKASLKNSGFRDRKFVDYENRIRSFSTPDKIFRYFATLRVTDDRGHSDVMMTPQDFLRSITPGMQQPENLGLDNFTDVSNGQVETVSKNIGIDDDSVFHQLGAGGLISFSDYVFLLTVLSTSRRHFEIAFKMFDLNGDGNVDAKEFEKVANIMRSRSSFGARHRDHRTTGSTLKGINSGLISYFFGPSRDGILTIGKFLQFHRRLQDEILILEFNRKRSLLNAGSSKEPRISEMDFADLLIAYAGFSSTKNGKMLKRVEKAFCRDSGGICLSDYLSFYQVLYAINDIDTALTFYTMAGAPVERSTMRHVAETVANVTLSDHVLDVVFALFDENGDGKLSNKEFVSVMKRRAMRGLEKPKDTGVVRIFSALAKCAGHSQPA